MRHTIIIMLIMFPLASFCQYRKLYADLTPRKLGYQMTLNTDYTGGLCEGRKYIQIRTGEFYLSTSKRNVFIESTGIEFSIRTNSKEVNLNLCNYKEDSISYLTLWNGSVTIYHREKKYRLEAGQFAEITKTVIVRNLTDYEWKKHIARYWIAYDWYPFINKPLYTIINRIARAREVYVKYINVPRQLVSGTISLKHCVDKTLNELMSQTLPFQYTLNGDTLVVTQ